MLARDAVGIGQRRHLGGGESLRDGADHAGEAPRFGADALDHAAVRGEGMVLGEPLRVADRGKAQRQVGGGAAQGVALFQQCRERHGLRSRRHQHVAKARMDGQGGQRPAVRGDAALRERTKAGQERPRLGERRGGRRREKGEAFAIRSPEREFEREAGQIGRGDLGRREGGKSALLALRPEPVADAFRHAASAAPALFGLGPCHPFSDEPRHARSGVEPRPPRPPAIDDDADVLDRQRCLGDGGGEHHLAPIPCGPDRGALGGKIHRAEQRADQAAGRQAAAKLRLDPADLPLARQEDEDAAFRFPGRLRDKAREGRLVTRPMSQRARQPARLDREGAAL